MLSNRFELSFKNIEVRIWIVIMVPFFIVGALFIIFAEFKYQSLGIVFPLIAWIIFYVWRFFYRRKQKEGINNPS